MLALMPRCTQCVLCGRPIPGKGRLDRIYCSASCRTLAWRARAGHCFDGRCETKLPPQPGDFIARTELPLLAVRMRAELIAAKRRIAELEEQLANQRGDAEHATGKFAVAVAAAAGALGLVAALKRWRRRRQRPAQERARDEVQAQRQRHRAEPTAERERAARREVELEQQVIALTARAEQADAREQAAVSSLSAVQGELLDARAQGRRHHEAYLEESRQRQNLQLLLNQVRGHRGILRYELEETDAKLTEESRLRQSLLSELADAQRQLGAERRAWQTTRAQLARDAQREQQALLTDNSQHRYLLAELKPRAEVQASTITKLQNEAMNQKRRYLEEIEESQRKQFADSQAERNRLSGQNEQTPLPDSKQQKQPLARSGVITKILGTSLASVTNGAREPGVDARLKSGERKLLPPNKIGNYVVVPRVPEPKRLPPKRD